MTMTRDQIERIRDGWAATGWLSTDDANALFDHALSEQSRIDAAVAKERERCIQIVGDRIMAARLGELDADLRSIGKSVSHAIRTPTPTTEEGA